MLLGASTSGALPPAIPLTVADGAVVAGTGILQSSEDIGSLPGRVKNWFKKTPAQKTPVWRCQDKNGFYMVAQPNSPGPQWELTN